MFQPFTVWSMPTHVASNACVFGSARRCRLYAVRPPEAASTGRPKDLSTWKIAYRVAFTAAASHNGVLAIARILETSCGSITALSLELVRFDLATAEPGQPELACSLSSSAL